MGNINDAPIRDERQCWKICLHDVRSAVLSMLPPNVSRQFRDYCIQFGQTAADLRCKNSLDSSVALVTARELQAFAHLEGLSISNAPSIQIAALAWYLFDHGWKLEARNVLGILREAEVCSGSPEFSIESAAFNEGLMLFREGSYSAAMETFKEASRLSGDAEAKMPLIAALGITAQRLGEDAAAVMFLTESIVAAEKAIEDCRIDYPELVLFYTSFREAADDCIRSIKAGITPDYAPGRMELEKRIIGVRSAKHVGTSDYGRYS
jgi:hypothetical protein